MIYLQIKILTLKNLMTFGFTYNLIMSTVILNTIKLMQQMLHGLFKIGSGRLKIRANKKNSLIIQIQVKNKIKNSTKNSR